MGPQTSLNNIMKLHELHEEELDEGIKSTMAAGALAAALAAPGAMSHGVTPYDKPEITTTAPEIDRAELARTIAKKYRVSRKLVQQVVGLAYKYEDPTFPKAADILAIVGIESSFNPKSRSRLRRDPAIGLMQVRPGIWNISLAELRSIESNIKHGANILRHYYKKLGSAEAAVQAYNLGLTKFRKGGRNKRYVAKYRLELAHNKLGG